MRGRSGFRRLFRLALRRPAAVEREVDDEIRSHIEARVEWLVARGLDPAAARAEAERRFGHAHGGLEGARRRLHAEAAAREQRAGAREWLDAFRQDVVFAVRQARRAPGHAATVVLVLALGIGVSTAVFSVLNAVLLRPLPFPEPDRLAVIWSLDSLGRRAQASAPTWRDWRAESRAFEEIALHQVSDVPVVPATPGADAVSAKAAAVTENFFDVLRPRMRRGRAFSADDAAAGRSVVVVSERFWRGPLGAPPRLPVALMVWGRRHDVVGVLAPTLAYPADADLWVSSCCSRRAPRNAAVLTAVGRLAPGRTLAQAERELDAVAARIREREPDALYAHGVALEPLREHLVGGTARSVRLVGAAGLLMLLIACANAAAASLVRGAARERELAIRASLGAGRGRILRQLVTEQLLLAAASGAIGVWLAHAGTRWLARSALGELPRAHEIAFDGRVLAAAAACTLLSAAIAGLLPTAVVRRASLRGTLAAGAAAAAGRRGAGGVRLGKVLVGAEVAVAVVLLAGAALLVEGFRSLVARDLGFASDRVAIAKVTLVPPRYESNGQRLAYLRDLEQSVRAVPGVAAVGLSTAPPFGATAFVGTGGVVLEGARSGDLLVAGYQVVSDDYFRAIGVPVVAGRAFDARDAGPGAPRVTVVNRTMAERYWPGESPIGKRLRAHDLEGGERAPWLTVVGVVGDVRPRGYASDPRPEHYVPYRQTPGFAWGMTLVVRSSAPLDAVLPAVRARMRALDPTLPAEPQPLDEHLRRSTTAWRLPMSVVSAFGAVALALATLGVYTVFAFAVARRTREIGVRMALGATGGAVLRATVSDALAVTLAGAAAGCVAAFLLAGLARPLLFEGTPVDAGPLVAAVAVLLAAAALAAYVPGRRAARVDPVVALRAE